MSELYWGLTLIPSFQHILWCRIQSASSVFHWLFVYLTSWWWWAVTWVFLTHHPSIDWIKRYAQASPFIRYIKTKQNKTEGKQMTYRLVKPLLSFIILSSYRELKVLAQWFIQYLLSTYCEPGRHCARSSENNNLTINGMNVSVYWHSVSCLKYLKSCVPLPPDFLKGLHDRECWHQCPLQPDSPQRALPASSR